MVSSLAIRYALRLLLHVCLAFPCTSASTSADVAPSLSNSRIVGLSRFLSKPVWFPWSIRWGVLEQRLLYDHYSFISHLSCSFLNTEFKTRICWWSKIKGCSSCCTASAIPIQTDSRCSILYIFFQVRRTIFTESVGYSSWNPALSFSTNWAGI